MKTKKVVNKEKQNGIKHHDSFIFIETKLTDLD